MTESDAFWSVVMLVVDSTYFLFTSYKLALKHCSHRGWCAETSKLTWSPVVLVNPCDRCPGREGDRLHEVRVAKEFAGNLDDISLAVAQDLVRVSQDAIIGASMIAGPYIVDSLGVPYPSDSANEHVGNLEVLHSFREGNLVLLTELNLLPTICPTAGHVKQVDSLRSEDRDIAEGILQLPALTFGEPVDSRYLPVEGHVLGNVPPHGTNNFNAKPSPVLEATSPPVCALIRL